MEIAGHSTIEMTMNVYGHVTLDEKRAALDKLGVEVVNKDAKTLVSWIERDTAKWAKLIAAKKVVTTE